jgi:choline dehydrogenase-like flavoprotein
MQSQANQSANGSSIEAFDFIVIGGGIAGTVIASRLHEREPSLSILLIEAGPDSSKTALAEVAASPAKVLSLRGSELDWNYETVPQKYLNDRKIYVGGGKAMGGGSVINFGKHKFLTHKDIH